MRFRFIAAALLLSSGLAQAADAPSQLALTECKLNYLLAKPVLSSMTPFNTGFEGDLEKDGYESDLKYYQISSKPFGLTGLEMVHRYTIDDDFGEEYDTLEVDVSESYEAAKAKLLAAAGKSKCQAETGVSPDRVCTIPRSSTEAMLFLNEAKGLTYFSCTLLNY